MCTILTLFGVRADYPLILATNRDEFFARPSVGPGRLLDAPLTVGGRDLVAGGTWMGVTRSGLFVGVTNQRTLERRDPTKRSRGELVLRALATGDADEVTSMLRQLDGRAYNAFNLMWGDARALYVGYGRADRRDVEIERVAPGLHVLPNDRLDSPSFVKVGRARALLRGAEHAPFPALADRLRSVLADRALPALDEIPDPPSSSSIPRERLRQLAALCVRTGDYGTRSSTIVAIGPAGVAYFTYADGPPDAAPFLDLMPLYAELPPEDARGGT